ncbi:MAG: helix-turn-helix transcriptional regulator [Nitrospira sp.]|nr:helix-turn-helix transcriptional regulator [Nitrospira sp.]
MRYKSTATAISRALREAKLTQSDMARSLKITPQSVQRWASGAGRPNPKHWNALILEFGVKEADLLADRDDDFNGFISLPSSPMKRVASQQHIRLLVQDDDRIEVAIRAVLPDHVAKHIRDCLIDPDGIDSLRIIRRVEA